MIRHDQIGHPCKGESSLIYCWSRSNAPDGQMLYSQSDDLEDLTEETKVDVDEVNIIGRAENTTHQWQEANNAQREFGRRGAILLDQVTKTTRSNVGSMEHAAITKRSAERRKENPLRLVDISRTMPRIPTMRIMAECF